MEFEERYLLSELMFLRQIGIAVVQSPSRVWLYATPWITALQASLTISQSLPKFMFIASVMPSSHLILCHPLLLSSIFLSLRVFSNESVLHIRWPKYWSFSFSISSSNEYSGLISLRMDWLGLLAIQGTLEYSPTPQFRGINSLAFCFLYGSALATICDHWEDHSLDYTDLCWKSDVSAFQHTV